MQKNEMLTPGQRRGIWAKCRGELGWNPDEVHEYIGKKSVNDLTKVEAGELLKALNRIIGEKERSEIQDWYRECEERFFLPSNVKSIDNFTSAQMRMIIHHAGIVFDQNLERFAGFLKKRMRTNIIATNNQARAIIQALKSMSEREMAK